MTTDITHKESLEEQILLLKHRLAQNDDSCEIPPDINNRPISFNSNRGSKLLTTTDNVSVSKLSSSRDNYQLTTIHQFDPVSNQYNPRLVYRDKNIPLTEIIQSELDHEFGIVEDEDNSDYYNDDDDDQKDIFQSLNIAEILKPITHPSDLINIKSIEEIYMSKHLESLADETICIIEREQENVNLLSKLMNVFLGDDPANILADNLHLPHYDHHLDLEKEMERQQQGQDGTLELSDDPVQDPFFRLPEYEKDYNFGISNLEEAEESRQLVQIALQRNEEFVRSLSLIRMGFIRANRLKNDVYKWCKEIDEEEKMNAQRMNDK